MLVYYQHFFCLFYENIVNNTNKEKELRNDSMNNIRFEKILRCLYEYYDIDKDEFMNFLRVQENKYVFLLLIKRNNPSNIYNINEKMGYKNLKNIRNNLKKAEMKLLINQGFREKYFEIEYNLRRELKI